jgi:hypothetical protein
MRPSSPLCSPHMIEVAPVCWKLTISMIKKFILLTCYYNQLSYIYVIHL